MCDLSARLEAERMASLAAHAGQPVSILKSIIVTPVMINAAVAYWEGLHSSDLNELRLDDLYRIMAANRPRHLEGLKECP